MTAGGQLALFGSGNPDGRTPETAISVRALNRCTQRLLEEHIPDLWVRGEVANWRKSSRGHRYFTLRDDRAQVDCVFFSGDAWRLPADPDNGMEVTVYGRPTLYEAGGRFQVVVRRLEAAGEGLWRVALRRLYRTLREEGLFEPSRKRPLPAFPRRVAVVTSRSGAALHDVLTVLRRRSPWIDVLVCDCRVQGEGAALEIRRALAMVGSAGVDAVILTRGGGSTEDLWCFNEEVAVRAVAACPVPVVCAIGHEVDTTLAELAADRKASTPSVAAELLAPDAGALRERLDVVSLALARGLRRSAARGRERLDRSARDLPRSMRSALGRGRERLDRHAHDLPRATRSALERGRARVRGVAGRLDALSPLATLARGYAVATDADGGLLASVDRFEAGSRFYLRVRDGSVEAVTERTRREAR